MYENNVPARKHMVDPLKLSFNYRKELFLLCHQEWQLHYGYGQFAFLIL